jgi:hypothetical protein
VQARSLRSNVTYVSPVYRYADVPMMYFIEEIERRILRARINPGEMIGSLAAESVGEPCTQLTLSSVEWNTMMVFQTPSGPRRLEIGLFIDEYMDAPENTARIVHIPENKTELFFLPEGITVPSIDEHGNSAWHSVTAVTRHLPGGDLVRIKTFGGCNVVATRSKSFLVWDKNSKTFMPTDGADVKVGDIVPSLCKFNDPTGLMQHSYASYGSLKMRQHNDVFLNVVLSVETLPEAQYPYVRK